MATFFMIVIVLLITIFAIIFENTLVRIEKKLDKLLKDKRQL